MNENQTNAGKMNILDLLKNILPFVLPYAVLLLMGFFGSADFCDSQILNEKFFKKYHKPTLNA